MFEAGRASSEGNRLNKSNVGWQSWLPKVYRLYEYIKIDKLVKSRNFDFDVVPAQEDPVLTDSYRFTPCGNDTAGDF